MLYDTYQKSTGEQWMSHLKARSLSWTITYVKWFCWEMWLVRLGTAPPEHAVGHQMDPKGDPIVELPCTYQAMLFWSKVKANQVKKAGGRKEQLHLKDWTALCYCRVTSMTRAAGTNVESPHNKTIKPTTSEWSVGYLERRLSRPRKTRLSTRPL